MKIVLSVVAIAAIAMIYGTGAFVPQTHGLDNTVAGFLAISNAEMAQQIGGHHTEPREGEQKLIDGGDFSKHCDANNVCYKPDHHRKEFDASYYVCTDCPPDDEDELNTNVNTNLNANIISKYSRFKANGKRNYIHSKVIVTCYFNAEKKCEPRTTKGGKKNLQSCEVLVGTCVP